MRIDLMTKEIDLLITLLKITEKVLTQVKVVKVDGIIKMGNFALLEQCRELITNIKEQRDDV